ncbi:MAG: carbohydrate binding family 9 domain-containing protein [candidate division KSB1 bacterium]|nr:carbohydrate binding family 9 domain-containing protein [candidate division KSB1 bacterium]
MTRKSVFLLFCVSSLIFANSEIDTTVYRNEKGKRIYTAQRLTTLPPRIDGRLDDPCWQNEGVWSGGFRQQIPREGAEPSAKTAIKILHDNRYLYVAVRAFDDMRLVDRHRGRRDEFSGDLVGVCFDSYFDHRTGFEFDLTAGGSKIDLILTNEGWDTSWDAVWDGKTAFEDSAWTAEFRIPLSQLRYANKPEQVWGLHAWRWINRLQEEDQWALIPRDTPGRMYDIGELHGIRDLPKNRRIELLPYARVQNKRLPPETGNPFTGSRNEATFGADAKLGLSSDFTMDVTINPDFGQVEADPAVLNLTVFETYFEEKRPFFLEGKTIFDFELENNQLFYSRRIGHAPSRTPMLNMGQYADIPGNTSILGAAKISGKSKDGLSVGILESLTRKEFAQIADGDRRFSQPVEPQTNYFVGRVQKDYNGSNTIFGGMLTAVNRRIEDQSLKFLPREAYTGGLDLRHYWRNKTYFIDAKTAFSTVQGSNAAITGLQSASSRYFQRPDADHVTLDTTRTQLSGHGGSISIGKGANGNWRWRAGVNWRSPGLELNDIGFMSEADVINLGGEIGYVENRPQGIFRTYTLEGGYDQSLDFGRNLLSRRFMLSFESEFINKWTLFWNVYRENDQLDPRLLRGGPAVRVQGWVHTMVNFSTDRSKMLSAGLRLHTHRHDDVVTKTLDVSPFVNWKVSNTVRLQSNLSLSRNTNALQYVTALKNDNGLTYILGELARKTAGMTLRLDISLSPEFTLQYYANPYISVGSYRNFKRVMEPRADDYNRLYHVYGKDELDFADGGYIIKENGAFFYNPDFSFRELRSNFVARWEFHPGSTLYFVWTHGRTRYENLLGPSFEDSFADFFDAPAQNIYLLKLNYWFSI